MIITSIKFKDLACLALLVSAHTHSYSIVYLV